MFKKILYSVGVALVLVFLLVISRQVFLKNTSLPGDYKEANYTIAGKSVSLTKGDIEFFGNEAVVDLNGDGRNDMVFLATDSSQKPYITYYLFAALNTPLGIVGSQGVMLGDRIAPQTTEIRVGKDDNPLVVVNYAERKIGDEQVSVGKSMFLKFDPATLQFGEVVQDFEGEADPKVMSLSMKKWTWMSAKYSDGKTITPLKPKAFTLTLTPDGRFSATTDCNGVGGEYTVNKNKIVFDKMMSTLMFCEGSQESVFSKLLVDSDTYLFTSKGELVLGLKMDSGTVVFK